MAAVAVVAEGVAAAGAAVRRDRRGVRGSRTGAGVGDALRITIVSVISSSSSSSSRWKMAVAVFFAVLRRLDVPDLVGEGTVVRSAHAREEGGGEKHTDNGELRSRAFPQDHSHFLFLFLSFLGNCAVSG